MRLLPFLLIPCVLFANTDRVIFHHIPKTGGITTRSVLNSNFSKEETLPEFYQFQIEGRPISELFQYKFIRGHFPVCRLKEVPGKRVTFLRGPIKRVLSAHRYYNQHFKKSPDNEISREFICSPEDPLETMRNHQCKFLSSLDMYDPNISDKEHLESAKYNLEHNFFFVGITEDLDNALPILCRLLKLAPPPNVPKCNRTRKPKEGYPEEIIRGIRERNWADIQLYSFAKQLYEKKYKAAAD